MNPNLPWDTRIRTCLLTGAAAAALVCLLILGSLTWRADAWIYDRLARSFPAPVDDRILVVAIDEKSLAELGRWPWSRRLHAGLINRLTAAGANGVALDILLSQPALFDPEGDALLAQAISRNGRVVLAVHAASDLAGGDAIEILPIPEFAGSAASLGHVDMVVDADGGTRSAFLRAGLGSAHCLRGHALSGGPTGSALALHGLRDKHQAKRRPALDAGTTRYWAYTEAAVHPMQSSTRSSAGAAVRSARPMDPGGRDCGHGHESVAPGQATGTEIRVRYQATCSTCCCRTTRRCLWA